MLSRYSCKLTQIFIDYDDTLFCTTVYRKCKGELEKKINLREFDEELHKFLQFLLITGEVYIVTGAENG